MNVSIEQYRAAIGLHNRIGIKNCQTLQANHQENSLFSFWLDSIGELDPAGLLNSLLLITIINYFFDVFHDCVRYNYYVSTTHPTWSYRNCIGFPNLNFINIDVPHSRIIISCIFYCIIINLRSVTCPNNTINLWCLYSRLFSKKSRLGCCMNLYSIWLFSINLILITLTIPNIINPGPLKDLNILYQNVSGFVNLNDKSQSPQFYSSKLNDFHGYIFNKKPDVIILNETWLKKSILDSELFPNNSYKVFRRDRSNISHPSDISCSSKSKNKFKNAGGGVIIAFRSDLDIQTSEYKISHGGAAKAEILSVVLKSGSGSKICFSTLYRVGTLGAENLSEVSRHLRSIISSKSLAKHVFIGDLNLNKTTWPLGQSSCSIEKGFIDLFHDFNFEQLIGVPTHKAGKTLDLLLCNQPSIISDIEVLPFGTVCNSDHCSISFKVKLKCKRLKAPKRKIYNMKKADFKSINYELCQVPWNNLLTDQDINVSLSKFESTFFSICDRYIPMVTVKSSFQPPWFDSELHSICKKKEKLLNKKKKTQDPQIKFQIDEEIKKTRKKFKKLSTQKKRDNVLNDDDPALIKKKFWSFFKSTSNSCRIPETVHYGNRFRSKDSDVANLFNKYFSDQFSSPSTYDINIDFSNDPHSEEKLDEKSIFDLLRKMNANKAAGPDGIQSKLMKMCAKGLAKPLAILFNNIFKSGNIPSKWKLANVVPVFKIGDKNSVTNYRPISLTSLPMKILEYCIKDLLMSQCEHLIKDNQHGFRSNKSCLTQLLPYVDKLSVAMNNKSRIDAVYFDFAKAFDSVNHDLILYKLKNKFGIDGLLLQFMRDYLRDRKQQVVINGSKSDLLPVLSGVPQGSILGPLLFVLFIDDICDEVSEGTELALYADDTKIWREILCDEDQTILQNDINRLFEWSVRNLMNFHPDKCKVIHVTNKSMIYPLPFYEFWYSLNGNILDYESSEKDLGVVIRSNLSWNSHCEWIVQKANNQLALVRRSCYFITDSKQRRALYLSLVRSLFEHCCQVWAPQNAKSLNLFEILQKRAVKWILKEQHKRYSDVEFLRKQQDLDLLPMKYKFLFSDLILFFRIVNNEVKINLPNYVTRIEPQDVKRVTRSTKATAEGIDRSKFRCSMCPKVKSFQDSYFVRTVDNWNNLPHELRKLEDPNKFSTDLKEHLWLILGLKPD